MLAERPSVSVLVAIAVRARARKMNPKYLAKARRAEPGGEGECGGGQRAEQLREQRRHPEPLQQRFEGEPFADEPAERRDRGERERGDADAGGAQRHAAGEAAERIDRSLAGGLLDAVNPNQRERLGEAGSTHLERRGEEAGRGEMAVVSGLAEQRDAETEQHDSGLLDGGVAEEAAKVVLGDGIGDPRDGGDRAQDQRGVAAPGGKRSGDVEHESPQSVEAGGKGDR